MTDHFSDQGQIQDADSKVCESQAGKKITKGTIMCECVIVILLRKKKIKLKTLIQGMSGWVVLQPKKQCKLSVDFFSVTG